MIEQSSDEICCIIGNSSSESINLNNFKPIIWSTFLSIKDDFGKSRGNGPVRSEQELFEIARAKLHNRFIFFIFI